MNYYKPLTKKTEGFTLIEILVVIGIIAVLAAVVLIAINPARQFAQANDSQRTANLNAILNAIGQYMSDNQGDLDPLNITSGDPDSDPWDSIDDSMDELCNELIPDYMPALPADPLADIEPVDDCSGSWGDTLYEVIQDEDTGRVSVRAPETQIDYNDDGSVNASDYITVTR